MTVEKSRASEGTAQGTTGRHLKWQDGHGRWWTIELGEDSAPAAWGLVELLKQRIGAMKAAIASAIKSLLGITSPSRCFSERGGAR